MSHGSMSPTRTTKPTGFVVLLRSVCLSGGKRDYVRDEALEKGNVCFMPQGRSPKRLSSHFILTIEYSFRAGFTIVYLMGLLARG